MQALSSKINVAGFKAAKATKARTSQLSSATNLTPASSPRAGG